MASQQPDAGAVTDGQPGDRLPAPGTRQEVEALTAELISATAVGISLITAERLRQLAVEGYTPEHDAEHSDGELALAAAAYALAASGRTPQGAVWWPFDDWGLKPGSGPLDSLVKAGALIAAEIDRIVAEAARRG